jgi:hypothetical protein
MGFFNKRAGTVFYPMLGTLGILIPEVALELVEEWSTPPEA